MDINHYVLNRGKFNELPLHHKQHNERMTPDGSLENLTKVVDQGMPLGR